MPITVKKVINKLHLWLGMTTGAVVFIVSITGAIYVFEEEINRALEIGVYKSVETQNKRFLSPSEIREIVDSTVKDTISYMNVTVYPSGDRANIVWVKNTKRKYIGIAQNPYSGNIIHHFSYNITFWAVIISLHTSLLIPEIGSTIVSISTIVYIALLASGLYLWFPKKKLSTRLRIKWAANPKRVNYDIHSVLGFYCTWIAIFIGITGLVMSYEWMEESVYWLVSGFTHKPAISEVRSAPHSLTNRNDKVDSTFRKILSRYNNNIKQYFFEYPTDSLSPYTLKINTENGFWVNSFDEYFINPRDGKVLQNRLYGNKTIGTKVNDANLNIHTGSILGITGKCVAFFVSLVSASSPVTGFLIWWGRRNKKKQKVNSVCL